MRSTIIGLTLAAVVGLLAVPASAKTVKECNAEYAANKDAIRGAGQKKADFVAACRGGTETIPGAASAPQAAPAPTTAAVPAPAPAPAMPAGTATTRRTVNPSAAAPSGANEFSAEAQATARCPGQTVVWVNTKSRIYHFAGTKNYGNTKAGAYMCEADAKAAGDRASMTEKHP